MACEGDQDDISSMVLTTCFNNGEDCWIPRSLSLALSLAQADNDQRS